MCSKMPNAPYLNRWQQYKMTAKFLTILLFLSLQSFAQDTCNDFPVINCNQFEENVIPTNLNEAISYIECLWGKDDLEKLKSYENQNENTQLYVKKKVLCIKQKLPLDNFDTKLYQFFSEKLNDLDAFDMKNIIFNSLYRKLNGKKINLNEQIENYREYYRKMFEQANTEYLERRNKEFGKFKIGDTVEFTYKHYFLERPEDCKVKAHIKKIDTTKFMLKLEIIKNCENEEFYFVYSKFFQKENEKFQLKSEEILNLRPKGEIIWTPYYYWNKIK